MRTIGYLLVLVSVFNCNSILHATLKDFENSRVLTLANLYVHDERRAQKMTSLLYDPANNRTYGSTRPRSSSSETVLSSAETVSCLRDDGDDFQARQTRQEQIIKKRQALSVSSVEKKKAEESESCIQTLSRGMSCLLGLCCKK